MPSKKTSDQSHAQAQDFPDQVRDSAHQIWLAGLAAFAKAQQEGSKVFDAMVKEGTTVQRKAQSLAEGKWHEATERMSHLASDVGNRATGQWDRIETIFEDRVARALTRLGVPTTSEVARLQEQIDELQRALDALRPGPAAADRPRTTRRSVPVSSNRRKTTGS